jgi:hypothetical protein
MSDWVIGLARDMEAIFLGDMIADKESRSEAENIIKKHIKIILSEESQKRIEKWTKLKIKKCRFHSIVETSNQDGHLDDLCISCFEKDSFNQAIDKIISEEKDKNA